MATKTKRKASLKNMCLLIQWSRKKKVVDKNNNPICPKCKEPAETVIGVFGEICYAHKP